MIGRNGVLPEPIPWRETLDLLGGLRWEFRLRAIVLCACFVLSWTGRCVAQEDGLTIRIEGRQVLVPFAWDGYVSCAKTRDKDLLKCSWDGAVNDHVNREAHVSGELWNPDDLGLLSLKDLRIFEDGKEQRIESVGKMFRIETGVVDNLGSHVEGAWVPTGIWSTSDLAADTRYSKGGEFYQIAYSPSISPEGSCHSIRIAGPHESKLVYRKEYCFVSHSTADSLNGSPEDKKLGGYLAAGKQGGIHPKMQGSSFYVEPGKARVNVDIEFPFDEVKSKELKSWTLPIDILILASGEDGRVIARHSGLFPAFKNIVSPPWVNLDWASISFTFVRYDAQIELPPGNYKLAFAYGHGPDFGIVEVPLTVDKYDGSQFAISSIALCKRVRKAGEKPVAKDFVPLVAGSDEFTPAGDTDFHNGDTLMAYFELYEPLSDLPPKDGVHVNYTMRIRNEQNGAVALQRFKNADSWVQPGKSTIPIAEKLVLSQLHLASGKYRFEIQATDSAGRDTALRTAEFWID